MNLKELIVNVLNLSNRIAVNPVNFISNRVSLSSTTLAVAACVFCIFAVIACAFLCMTVNFLNKPNKQKKYKNGKAGLKPLLINTQVDNCQLIRVFGLYKNNETIVKKYSSENVIVVSRCLKKRSKNYGKLVAIPHRVQNSTHDYSFFYLLNKKNPNYEFHSIIINNTQKFIVHGLNSSGQTVRQDFINCTKEPLHFKLSALLLNDYYILNFCIGKTPINSIEDYDLHFKQRLK